MVDIIQDFIPKGSINRPGRTNPMKYITIHNTGNISSGSGAKSHANYLKSLSASSPLVSWHYTVDDKIIYHHIPDNEDAFHAGDGSGSGNRQSIGIEICMNSDGDILKATDNAINLVAKLCLAHNISISNIRQHYDWTGKDCPQMIRSGIPYNWNTFISKVTALMDPVKIAGKSVMSAEQLATYLLKQNPNPKINCSALDLAHFFIDEGNIEGIRGDIAFCQSINETGWFRFGGQVLPEQNNFCGLGALSEQLIGQGAWFDTPRLGVRAQIQHLKAYANKEPLVMLSVDPRFSLVTRGSATTWIALNGKWAVPGIGYGESILKLFEEGKAITVDNTLIEKNNNEITSDWAEDAWNWGVSNSFIDGTNPKAYVTREQLITIIYRIVNKAGIQ